MRASAAALLSLFAFASAAPGQAADLGWSPGGSYTFVQGQTYTLDVTQPAIDHFLGYELYLRYSPDVYDPLGFALGPLAQPFDQGGEQFQYLSIDPPVQYAPADAPSLREVFITAAPSTVPLADITPFGFNIPAGTAFSVTFKILADAPLTPGAGDVSGRFVLLVGDPSGVFDTLPLPPGTLTLSPTIAAVPEPATWATLLFGLALVAGVAARRRTGMRLPLA